ncbi:hypothetical protein [Rhodococcus sp. SORGH_AS_0301]|uniref:hypothetical protein n=1 Tax=Rhodococcus sp. SORGH_AS_0301 TaxID=3041780 RepID=UPI002782ECDB|nr:hypothetical protein [Rhodococcus sp. SORGH_AS_0301]MDQ1178630.1 hypothetical protein [Rhodococcus sp. SORGH_AS_0301]
MQESPTPPPEPNWVDEHPKARWLATSRTTGVAAVGFIVLVVVLVGVVLVRSGGSSDTTPAAAPSTSAGPTSAPSTANGAKGGFGPSIADPFGREIAVPINEQGQLLSQTDPGDRPGFERDVPVPAPAGIMWQRIGATVAPFSTSDGPTRIDGRLAYGFTRTPQGAALAGWQIAARTLRSGADVREVYNHQIVADPGVAESKLAQLAAAGQSDFQLGRAWVFPQAFKVTAFSDSFAVVQYATPIPGTGQWDAQQSSLTWTDDGWKVRLSAVDVELGRISTLNGWTRW